MPTTDQLLREARKAPVARTRPAYSRWWPAFLELRVNKNMSPGEAWEWLKERDTDCEMPPKKKFCNAMAQRMVVWRRKNLSPR